MDLVWLQPNGVRVCGELYGSKVRQTKAILTMNEMKVLWINANPYAPAVLLKI